MKEIWKDIPEYEGKYRISNLGNVKSINYHNTKKECTLSPAKDAKGYLRCSLSKNNILKTFKVHRLVAQSFIPNPLELPQVNHIDGNKLNNAVNNLEWCDNSMNQIHAYKVGLNPKHVGHKVGVIIINEDGKIAKFDTKMDAALYLGYKTIMPLNRVLKNGKVKKKFKILLDV